MNENVKAVSESAESAWKETKISDLCDLIVDCVNRTAPKVSYPTPFKMIRTTNVRDGKINTDQVNYVTEKTYKTWIRRGKPTVDDIILTREAPVGEVGIVRTEENIFLGQRTMMYRANKSLIEPQFLYYSFLTSYVKEQLIGAGMGSVVDHIRVPDAKEFLIRHPLLSEQKAIAQVLSSLDDKIDLLHRQNKTLEAIAETLFRQWFIEEAQDDWEEVALGDVAIVQNGFAFRSKDYVEYQDGFLEVFKMGHIKPGGGLRFSPKANYVPRSEKLEKWILRQSDIVMAMTDMKDSMGILGHPAMIDISSKYVLNQRVARICLENRAKLISIYLLYLQLNTEDAIALLQSKANSGVQVNLSTEAIKSLPLIVPSKEAQIQALKNIEPIFKKALINRTQIQTLEKFRDTLLPKLMSGEVRVSTNALAKAS